MDIRPAVAAVCVCLLAGGVSGCATSPGAPSSGGAAGAAAGVSGRPVKFVFSRAEGYFYSGRYHDALVDYDAVIAADPSNAVALRSRAATNAALGREAAALADYERAVTISPRYDEAWFGRGLFLFSRGRYGEALDDFDRAAAIDPRNALVQRYRALVCERVGRLRDAKQARENYVHCVSQTKEGEPAGVRPEPREVKALGLSEK